VYFCTHTHTQYTMSPVCVQPHALFHVQNVRPCVKHVHIHTHTHAHNVHTLIPNVHIHTQHAHTYTHNVHIHTLSTFYTHTKAVKRDANPSQRKHVCTRHMCMFVKKVHTMFTTVRLMHCQTHTHTHTHIRPGPTNGSPKIHTHVHVHEMHIRTRNSHTHTHSECSHMHANAFTWP